MTRTMRAALKVAEREFVERATSRVFLVSNAVLLLLLLGALAVPALLEDDGVRRLGYTPQAEQTAQAAQRQASQFTTDMELVAVDDGDGARAALRPVDRRDDPPAGVPRTRSMRCWSTTTVCWCGRNCPRTWSSCCPARRAPRRSSR